MLDYFNVTLSDVALFDAALFTVALLNALLNRTIHAIFYYRTM